MKLTPTAAYIRVSTQEQKLHGISLDAQRDKLKEYAKHNNLQIVGWYEDEGISGRKLIKNRPALQRMIQDAEGGLFRHIIFIKLDRFFRSVAEYHECMKRLGSVTWDATEEKYDLTTASGRLLVNSKLMVAEYEADTTGERIKLTNEYKVKTGSPLSGRIPYGFKIISTSDGKRIVVNENERENALKIIDYFLKSNSLKKTEKFAMAYHSFGNHLNTYLRNTMLYGFYRGNNNYCEPLIDKATFDRLQAILERNTRERVSTKHVYKFRKLIVCPICGNHLNTISTSNTNGRYHYYRCQTSYNRLKYDNHHTFLVGENRLERCLLDNLESFVEIKSAQVKQIKKNPVNRDAIQDEINRLNYMFQKGYLEIPIYEEQYQKLQDKLQESEPIKDDISDKIDRLNEILKEGWKALYMSLEDDYKAQFWHSFIKHIVIDMVDKKPVIKDIIFL